MITNNFISRHNGPRKSDIESMLKAIGTNSLPALIDETIPLAIRLDNDLDLPAGMNEYEFIQHLKELAGKNDIFRTYIGMGYYNTIMPGVVQRNILENPGWYTSYTPYQAEISQGRLEALLNYQTMISDLTGLPLANASLLDEGTAAAEAMIMAFNARSRAAVKRGVSKFFVDRKLFPQTIDILKTRSAPLHIELVFGDHTDIELSDDFFGGIVQYPDQIGAIHNYKSFVEKLHAIEAVAIVAADLLSLTLLKPPGEWGADVVVGSSQRFGLPVGFGGPHAGYFATTEKYKRNIPGRIIGKSKDMAGRDALRMALQTREQHIKRERATSNICTAQALLAIISGVYASYHGAEGLKEIAGEIHRQGVALSKTLEKLGYHQSNEYFFDTLKIELPANIKANDIHKSALKKKINLRTIDDGSIGISLDETTSDDDLKDVADIFAEALNKHFSVDDKILTGVSVNECLPSQLIRTSDFLTSDPFTCYRSETDMMRYLKKLENKDLALNRTMIPLGSCTMKLNAASELFALSWPEFGAIHPFVPVDQAAGYLEMIKNLEESLCEITGFSAISFQPNSGASGEHTGLMVIREYHKDRGEGHRNICLIPASAHGTNPASSVMAGLKVVVVKTDEGGNIDIDDLTSKAEQYKTELAAIMITYPSTHGVYEEGIMDIVKIVHENGGQVYMDGANMNAQVGFTNPGRIGADVCHLNLHKTFAIPHGGGGPGVGPIGVAKHLKPFLPSHPVVKTGGEKAITAVSSAPYGSAFILPLSYAYIKLLGGQGLKEATEMAILNANYIKVKLEPTYKILYTGKQNRVAHEMILDCNEFHRSANILVSDIAKRLMDYGFHAPTVAFPVVGTLMVEPTESEPLTELDRFCDAMLNIRNEIKEIEEGQADMTNNVLKNAPHTLQMVAGDEWSLPYSRSKAAFPMKGLQDEKYFTPVTRIDDAFGDRNLVCTCNPVEDYEE